jgi:hypothetical protein
MNATRYPGQISQGKSRGATCHFICRCASNETGTLKNVNPYFTPVLIPPVERFRTSQLAERCQHCVAKSPMNACMRLVRANTCTKVGMTRIDKSGW